MTLRHHFRRGGPIKMQHILRDYLNAYNDGKRICFLKQKKIYVI